MNQQLYLLTVNSCYQKFNDDKFDSVHRKLLANYLKAKLPHSNSLTQLCKLLEEYRVNIDKVDKKYLMSLIYDCCKQVEFYETWEEFFNPSVSIEKAYADLEKEITFLKETVNNLRAKEFNYL